MTGIAVLVLLLAGNALNCLNVWVSTRFSWSFQRLISKRLLHQYLEMDYTSISMRNSSELTKNVLAESCQLSQGVLSPLLSLFASLLTILLILVFLMMLNPMVTVALLLTFGSIYVVIYLSIRRRLFNVGERRLVIDRCRYILVTEMFRCLKEIKVLGLETSFEKRFESHASEFSSLMEIQTALSQMPRYLIESVGFGLVISFMLYIIVISGDTKAVLPVISAFTLGGYKLLPAMQQGYQSFSTLRINHSVVDLVCKDLHSDPVEQRVEQHGELLRPCSSADGEIDTSCVGFVESIQLDNISYRYPSSEQFALEGVSMLIKKNQVIGLVGGSGAGKTTLVNILLGLIRPDSGKFSVDGKQIVSGNIRFWQDTLGYVPQEIYLTDDTVAANIAFGRTSDEIDMDRVINAARTANIHAFVRSDLQDGYDARVGENGVRLSGGNVNELVSPKLCILGPMS